MNNKEEVYKTINELLLIIKSGASFSIEQAPLIFKEIILYKTCFHSFFLLGGIMLAFFGFKYSLIYRKKLKETELDPLPYILFVFSFIPVLVAVFNFIFLLKVFLAPRLYLIEYLKQLAR